jgi:hypothetical protein
MSNKSNSTVATMGIDIGKNSFHVVGRADRRDARGSTCIVKAAASEGKSGSDGHQQPDTGTRFGCESTARSECCFNSP